MSDVYEKIEDADSTNDVKVKRTKSVEQENFFTLNQLTQQIVDLGIRKKTLQNDLVEIDEELAELKIIETEVKKIAGV